MRLLVVDGDEMESTHLPHLGAPWSQRVRGGSEGSNLDSRNLAYNKLRPLTTLRDSPEEKACVLRDVEITRILLQGSIAHSSVTRS